MVTEAAHSVVTDAGHAVGTSAFTTEWVRCCPGPMHPWVMHNTALKTIRDQNEDNGSPKVWGVDLTQCETYPIMTLVRGEQEMYTLTEPWTPWSWRKMLHALNDKSLEQVVGTGIVRITCEPIPDTPDGKRLRAARKHGQPYPEGARVPVWDFVITRVDGSKVRFHPDWKKKTFSVAPWGFQGLQGQGQGGAQGKSEGKGSYRRMLGAMYDGGLIGLRAGVGSGVAVADANNASPRQHRKGKGGDAVPQGSFPTASQQPCERDWSWRGAWGSDGGGWGSYDGARWAAGWESWPAPTG